MHHRHPAGEEVFAAYSKTGCVVMFVVPEEVEILDRYRL